MKAPIQFRVTTNGTKYHVEGLVGKLWWKKWKPLDKRGWEADVHWFSEHTFIETYGPIEFESQKQAVGFMQSLIPKKPDTFWPVS